MNHGKIWVRLAVAVILALFFCIALYLRIALPYDKVFFGDWVKFTGTDTYFYIRLVDNIIHNYPKIISFDPYNLFPGGNIIINPPFFHFFLSTLILIVGLGSPSPELIDQVSVYFPAVLGALTVLPVFFIVIL